MEFAIHYEVDGYEDKYIISGDTVEEVREANQVEMQRRGLHEYNNNCWSEQVGGKK